MTVTGGTVRAVDIPDWFVWIALVLVVFHSLALVPVIRRFRGPDPVARTKARFDLLESAGNVMLFASVLLSFVVESHWVWLTFAGAGLVIGVNVVKGFHWLRGRRRGALSR